MVTRSTDKVCAAWVTARQHYQWISFSLQPQIFCQPTPFCYWAVFADYPQTAGEFAASSDRGVGMYPRFAILNSCKKLPVPSFYICTVIDSFCFSQPKRHNLRLCCVWPVAAKLVDNKTVFCHSDIVFPVTGRWITLTKQKLEISRVCLMTRVFQQSDIL